MSETRNIIAAMTSASIHPAACGVLLAGRPLSYWSLSAATELHMNPEHAAGTTGDVVRLAEISDALLRGFDNDTLDDIVIDGETAANWCRRAGAMLAYRCDAFA